MNNKIVLNVLFVLILSTVVNSQSCSTYNPCGQYGYCSDDASGTWECTCKFWWMGTYCNQLSNSGVQVIVLGILAAIVILIFYGIAIFCSIRKKKQEPKKEKTKDNPNDALHPALKHVALANVKESTRVSSCIIAVLMVVITVIASTVEWSLLQPIHNELVKKYQQEVPLYYERNSFCDLIDAQDFNLLTFPVACLVILIFIIFSKRTSCMRNKFKGYFAPVIPIDFFIHIKRKFAAVIFAIVANDLFNIITDTLQQTTSKEMGSYLDFIRSEFKVFLLGVIIVYLLRIAKILVIGIRYYPTLAGVYIDSILTLACATLYAWLDFSVSVVSQGLCGSDFYTSYDDDDGTNETALTDYFTFYGTGQNLIIIQVFYDLPRFICWSYIVIKLPMLLIKKIYMTIKKKSGNQANRLHLTREEKILLHSSVPHSVEMSYVRNLFRSVNQRPKSRLLIARLIPKLIYEWRDDFRFSSRILCVYASVLFLLLFLTLQLTVFVLPYIDYLQQFIQQGIDLLTATANQLNVQKEFPIPHLITPYLVAVFTALIVIILQLLILLANIRRNLFQIYRGDDSEIPKRDKSRYLNYATGNFHFAGYFIGYLFWGYILIAIFAIIVYICIDSFITFGSVRFLEKILKSIIPVLLLVVFKLYLNKILARYVFLQHYGEILALNNRRVLMIFLYFNFFLDSILGFISSIIRIILSVICGCFYMVRLDYSPMGRKLEILDSGFSAYCGFIHMEAAHRNPIMLVVASHLYGRMKAKQHMTAHSATKIENNQSRSKNYSSKAIRKWFLARFLLRNPQLVFLRKHALRQSAESKAEALNEIKNTVARIEQMSRRASLISELELQQMWQKTGL